jgi:general nucleoside transport system permease protein
VAKRPGSASNRFTTPGNGMRLALQPRAESSTLWMFASPVLAFVLTIAFGAALFASLGKDPVKALSVFLLDPLSNVRGLSEVLLKSIPLILCGVGLAICYRANVWNIGAEGQLIFGAICAGATVLAFDTPAKSLSSGVVIPLACVAGMLGGMFWAGITAWLRARFNANEILVSLMLTYIAGLLLIYLCTGPLRDPDGYNFPQSKVFSKEFQLAYILEKTRLHWGFLAALAIAAAGTLFVSRAFVGYKLQVGGLASKAARYAGFSATTSIWMAMLICGALAGLAGAMEVMGPIGQLIPSVSPGYGFAAIIVAWIGRLHPVGVVLGALIMSVFYIGGEYAQSRIGLPSSITGIFQGALLFFLLACDTLIDYRVRLK